MTSGLYLSADEAAALLGVNVGTLYAYVKRKGIRTLRAPGRRASLYWREDVERVALKLSAASTLDPASSLVRETTITAITPEGHFYRGHSALELSTTGTLENVASLLWQIDETHAFPQTPPKVPKPLTRLFPAYAGLGTLDKAFGTFTVLEYETPASYDLSHSGYTKTAGELLRWFAAIVSDRDHPTCEPVHEVLARLSDEPKLYADLVRRVLVLSADHELDPTTYVVRATANTGATPYRTVLAGFCASQGQRVAFGRMEAMGRLLGEIIASPTPQDVISARLRDGESIPGFGSKRYADGDPRAAELLRAMRASLDGDAPLERFTLAINAMREVSGLAPDLPLVNAFLGKRLNLPRPEGVVGRLGRIVGWVAHAMEQYHGAALVRPRAAYVGQLPKGAQPRL